MRKLIYFKNAYHPILWMKNQKQQLKTVPQTLTLHEKQQIIVISGPNAGGKSITLKTIGLLQMMLQSGFFLPLNENSELGDDYCPSCCAWPLGTNNNAGWFKCARWYVGIYGHGHSWLIIVIGCLYYDCIYCRWY